MAEQEECEFGGIAGPDIHLHYLCVKEEEEGVQEACI
jgi:hypothetical protein